MRRRAAVFALAALAAVCAGAANSRGEAAKGIWISQAELAQFPRRGDAWAALRAASRGDLGEPEIANQNSVHDVRTLAAALVYARTGNERYRRKAARELLDAIGTESGGSTLALARNLVGYVLAADLVDLQAYDPAGDARFRRWLRAVRQRPFAGPGAWATLVDAHRFSANNWGTHAGASRLAIALYLGDAAEVRGAARVFRGWLGDRAAYAKFRFERNRSWQSDPKAPVGVNPPGATKDGRSIDGALAEEMRRGGKFRWPPLPTGYPWEALQGAVVQAELLHRRGFRSWEWQSAALRRAVAFLHALSLEAPDGSWWAKGDDCWIVFLVNMRYGTSFPTCRDGLPGKNVGWTEWTHSRARR